MKKLKKLFNLLPAFAIAFVSGLFGLLHNDQTISDVKADTSVLLSNRTITDYHLTFTDYTDSHLQWDWVFDYEINFYHDIGQDNFYFVLNIVDKYPQWSFTYNGVTKFMGVTENRTETLVSTRMSLASVSFNSTLTFRVLGISSNSNSYYFDELFGYWTWFTNYRVTYTLSFPNSSGFSPSSVNLVSPSDSYYDLVFRWDSQPSGFVPSVNSPWLYNSTNITQYIVDYTQSNYDQGYSDGYSTGYNDGFNVGYDSGYSAGNTNGYNNGFEAGVASQEQEIIDAYNNGYSVGYNDGYNVDGTVVSIFSGILQIGALPINIFLAIFNFEILGINLSAFISAILTVCLTVIIIRAIKGGGSSE